jgi:predicted acylesterase/phospholipase RssA
MSLLISCIAMLSLNRGCYMLGYALSGGGSKGDFECGAIRYLYENGYIPHVIVGTSVGAVNGAKAASGTLQSVIELEHLWKSMEHDTDLIMFNPVVASIAHAIETAGEIVTSDGAKAFGFLSGLFAIAGVPIVALAPPFVAIGVAAADAVGKISDALVHIESISTLDPVLLNLCDDTIFKPSNLKASPIDLYLASVELESGHLVYVDKHGQMFDRWLGSLGIPVHPAPADPEYNAIRDRAMALRQKMRILRRKDTDELKNENKKTHFEVMAGLQELRLKLIERAMTGDSDALVRVGVLGSASIAGLFPAIKSPAGFLVDGGMRDQLPLEGTALAMARRKGAPLDAGDMVIAISAQRSLKQTNDRQYGPAEYSAISKLSGNPLRMSDRVHVIDALLRAFTSIVMDEGIANEEDLLALSDKPSVLISPEIDIHESFAIEPGKTDIRIGYGYMRANDIVSISHIDRSIAAGSLRSSEMRTNDIHTARSTAHFLQLLILRAKDIMSDPSKLQQRISQKRKLLFLETGYFHDAVADTAQEIIRLFGRQASPIATNIGDSHAAWISADIRLKHWHANNTLPVRTELDERDGHRPTSEDVRMAQEYAAVYPEWSATTKAYTDTLRLSYENYVKSIQRAIDEGPAEIDTNRMCLLSALDDRIAKGGAVPDDAMDWPFCPERVTAEQYPDIDFADETAYPNFGFGSLIVGRAIDADCAISTWGTNGNLEVFVARSSSGFTHYWRDNDALDLRWSETETLLAGTAVAGIDMCATRSGMLHAIVTTDAGVLLMRRDANLNWSAPVTVASGRFGRACGIYDSQNETIIVATCSGGNLVFFTFDENHSTPPRVTTTPFPVNQGNRTWLDGIMLLNRNLAIVATTAGAIHFISLQRGLSRVLNNAYLPLDIRAIAGRDQDSGRTQFALNVARIAGGMQSETGQVFVSVCGAVCSFDADQCTLHATDGSRVTDLNRIVQDATRDPIFISKKLLAKNPAPLRADPGRGNANLSLIGLPSAIFCPLHPKDELPCFSESIHTALRNDLERQRERSLQERLNPNGILANTSPPWLRPGLALPIPEGDQNSPSLATTAPPSSEHIPGRKLPYRRGNLFYSLLRHPGRFDVEPTFVYRAHLRPREWDRRLHAPTPEGHWQAIGNGFESAMTISALGPGGEVTIELYGQSLNGVWRDGVLRFVRPIAAEYQQDWEGRLDRERGVLYGTFFEIHGEGRTPQNYLWKAFYRGPSA